MNAVHDEREAFAAFLLRMRQRGIGSKELFAAIEATPRHNFVPGQWHDALWSEGMLPIECGEAIEGIDLQAAVMAALDLAPGQRVLEIGTGSGFTAALLGRLSGRVLSVERYKTLGELARQRLETLGIGNVVVRHADGSKPLVSEGPFDRIVVWAAFDSYPRSFVEMLSTGGVMIAPVGPGDGEQELMRLAKVGSRFEREDIGRVRLQPITPGMASAL
jgi:protein-L-isoaspartate(D-aspartate) O-methyltransferase